MGARATECCWICLQEDGELVQACACPRGVHLDCLAYWQLHSAGTAEELACRFCSRALPNWKLTLSRGARPAAEVPVVAVLFGGCEWRLLVPPTPEGRLRFQRQVELLTGLPFQEQEHIKFYCKTPTGKDVSLCGTRCLEAAIHCAALHCAHQRQSEGAEHSAPHQSMPPSCPLPATTQQEPQQQHQEPQQRRWRQQQQQEQGQLHQQGPQPLHPSGTQSQQPETTTEARQRVNSSKNLVGGWQRLSWLSRLSRGADL